MSKSTPPKLPEQKIPPWAHVVCGWPLILVAIGGFIGGGLGGAAYGINIQIYKSSLPVVLKAVLNVVTGIAAFVLWIGIVAILQQYFR